jgi:hypothetical protein
MPFTEQPPKAPTDIPVVNPATGKVSVAWLRWFADLSNFLKRMGASIP